MVLQHKLYGWAGLLSSCKPVEEKFRNGVEALRCCVAEWCRIVVGRGLLACCSCARVC